MRKSSRKSVVLENENKNLGPEKSKRKYVTYVRVLAVEKFEKIPILHTIDSNNKMI